MADQKIEPVSGRPPFQRIALLLQGGGALGSYQAGVYQALAEANLHPDCVAGISIGAINAALIAGNPPERRVKALRTFWETVTETPPGVLPLFAPLLGLMANGNDLMHRAVNRTYAFSNLLGGAPGFFAPRDLPFYLMSSRHPETESFYDVSPLRKTLLSLVDFDRIGSKSIRLCVGAVNVKSGNMRYFDSDLSDITVDHVMASGSLPPGFPATKVDGEYYWDGGLLSNTPLDWVLGTRPRMDTLAFQVDLWNARGELPQDLIGLDLRQKEIRYSSRTRANTDQFKKMQRLRRAAQRLINMVPDQDILERDPELALLRSEADATVYNIVHLIYRAKRYEGSAKDFLFSRGMMEEHWTAGYEDTARTLSRPEVLQRPSSEDGVATFDEIEP
ncbi:MAG: patatin-like phospholipase family protein [Pseudorhodoplanes sp.]|uniref:patatin-like phospholipase family protein n=1 Tax=Pseudorhodoplanes sp. TaxID=1934341 RepID=UPI003D14E620